jgi:ATP-dependent Clp protease ATP-binding subunit ClpB
LLAYIANRALDAPPSVFNILLQILDDGRLTDGKGRTVDFKNTVIIMTSNIASPLIHEAMNGKAVAAASSPPGPRTTRGDDEDIAATDRSADPAAGGTGTLTDDLKKEIHELLLQHFRPEFLNRVDEIVIFNGLGKEQIEQAVALELENLRKLLAERKIQIELTDKARELLFREGYDPQFGARPLKRALQRLIQDPLAMKLLDGDVLPGESLTVDTDLKKTQMRFERATAKAAR